LPAASLIKTVMFTVAVPGTVAIYVPYRLRGSGAHLSKPLGSIGLAPIAAGVAVYLWCAWDFATFGRGTPLPLDAPDRLVARGLYRFIRNPMYFGVLLVIFGQALWYASVATLYYGLAVAIAFHLFVISYEEPALTRQFGESYREYCRRVPRWIIRPFAKRARAK